MPVAFTTLEVALRSWAFAGEQKKKKRKASRHAARRAWAFMLMLMLMLVLWGGGCEIDRGRWCAGGDEIGLKCWKD